MYKLVFFVPESHLAAVKGAVFAAGAGKLGNYDMCCWQTSGQGQFRPLAGSDPFIGREGELTVVTEYRVEVVCTDECITAALSALRRAHPYEEPAIDIWRLEDLAAIK
jgi:hypothetical protein